ncbi:alpha-2,8-sialyltransferase 8F isoform X2 [Channa argus]|uniref:alpha-2,8-sialyltransferase 8F isoform X2 n=1 Tax=Channa argus TaxID=215402 RepID=UPI003522DB1B
MRGRVPKSLLMIILLCVGSLLTTLICNVEPPRASPEKKSAPHPSDTCNGCRSRQYRYCSTMCVCHREIINTVLQRYSQTWKRQEQNYQKFRSQLSSKCHGFDKAIITQANIPVGSKLVYDGDRKRTLHVTPEIFRTFVKVHPFSNKTLDTCAVVGNGGILTNSSCGRTIDSAQFVIRCNLPPLQNGYEKHVGIKTDIVTANPSIFLEKYGALMGHRRPFVESLRSYGNSLLLIPAFSFGHNTPVSMRAVYTIEDFESPTQPIFFNPEYLRNLTIFWRSQGLREVRLSTGIIMTSLALEVCTNVHLYGFWPFSYHPRDLHVLTNHYYDDRKTKTKFHTMSAEFELLLQLHSKGVLRLHLGECQPGEK